MGCLIHLGTLLLPYGGKTLLLGNVCSSRQHREMLQLLLKIKLTEAIMHG